MRAIVIILLCITYLTFHLKPFKTYVSDYLKRDGKRVPLGELKSVPSDSPTSTECTYDIWQRRVPQNRSFGKGTKKKEATADENVLNYESTI